MQETDAKRSWTVKTLLRVATEFLGKQGVEDARLEAELLLAHALCCDRLRLYTRFDMPLGDRDVASYRDLISRRAKGEPTAYILGRREFYGEDFFVDPRCLIPRPETELLVDEALRFLKARPEPARVLDVGVGSGCILLTLARHDPRHDYVGMDSQEGALAVAQHNAQALLEEGKAHLLLQDLFDGLPSGGFDVICSNPPYITSAERPSLSPTVREFEPESALFSGDDPVLFHREILRLGLESLNPGGFILLELPQGGDHALGITPAEMGYQVTTLKDLAGIPRVLMARR